MICVCKKSKQSQAWTSVVASNICCFIYKTHILHTDIRSHLPTNVRSASLHRLEETRIPGVPWHKKTRPKSLHRRCVHFPKNKGECKLQKSNENNKNKSSQPLLAVPFFSSFSILLSSFFHGWASQLHWAMPPRVAMYQPSGDRECNGSQWISMFSGNQR